MAGGRKTTMDGSELTDGASRGFRIVMMGLGLLWLLAGAVCLKQPSPEQALGGLATVVGLTLLIGAPLLPRAQLRGSVLHSGWALRARCNLDRLTTAQVTATEFRGEVISVMIRVSDADGGRAGVSVRADGRGSALVRAVAGRVLDKDPGLTELQRDSLQRIVEGQAFRKPRRHRFDPVVLAVLLVATAWVGSGVYEDWSVARNGSQVPSSVTAVLAHSTARGNQSTTICTEPEDPGRDPSAAGSAGGTCFKIAGAASLEVGDLVTLRIDPADPDHVVLEGYPPPDLGFFAFGVAFTISWTCLVLFTRSRRRADCP